ncbi:MAG: hypothetical protein EOP88_10350 [Verrucomicrobiaceae bacterium]|nr:MAG: hypothetical protein EOP88_10350 [Verrucomicrobiaceae bacterium]
MNEFLSIRFTGGGVAPDNTRCKELASVIAATESLLSAMWADHDDADPVFLSLVSLEHQSIGLKFAAFQMALALALWQDLAVVINTGRFDKMPAKARVHLAEISSFVKRRGCTAILGSSQTESLASFDSSLALPQNLSFKGDSSLVGEVIGVGGISPKVKLKLGTGRSISCETSEVIAKELGHRLYETVHCFGTATWDNETLEVLKFQIREVGEFKRVKVSRAFEDLASSIPSTMNRWQSLGILGIMENFDHEISLS